MNDNFIIIEFVHKKAGDIHKQCAMLRDVCALIVDNSCQ